VKEKPVSMIRNCDGEGIEKKDYCGDCAQTTLLENATEHPLPSQSSQEHDRTKEQSEHRRRPHHSLRQLLLMGDEGWHWWVTAGQSEMNLSHGNWPQESLGLSNNPT
jgi:hypothetical protein